MNGDEVARLSAASAARARRNRGIYATAAVAALVLGGAAWYRDYSGKQERQRKLDDFERWAALDKGETGSFFNCVVASEMDMNLVSNAQQVQMRIESAYFTQQTTFADHLRNECVPKIDRARQAVGGLRDAPAELAAPIASYEVSLGKLAEGVEDYAEKVKSRKGVKDIDKIIQETGAAWHQASAPTPEAVAFEKFMHCAVPGLAKMKDAQALLEHLAEACYKKDPVSFMDQVRRECGAILGSPDPKATPSATWKLSQKRFYEEEARQLRAWEDCAKRSRKGKKTEDLALFLGAIGEYMEARAGVVKAARDVKGAVR